MEFIVVECQKLMNEVFQLRTDVFVNEMAYDIVDQFDEYDKDALHLVCLDNKVVVAYARLYKHNSSLLVSRVCTKQSERNKGIATLLMQEVRLYAIESDFLCIELEAVNSVIPFYESLGFELQADQYAT